MATPKKVTVSSQPATLLVEDQITQSESELEELWADGAYVSWLGGPAIGAGEWPHRDDGQPLIHIASISLEFLIGSSEFEISDISVRRPLRILYRVMGDLRFSRISSPLAMMTGIECQVLG